MRSPPAPRAAANPGNVVDFRGWLANNFGRIRRRAPVAPPRSTFTMVSPPPGVLPPSEEPRFGMAQDSFNELIATSDWAQNQIGAIFAEGQAFLGYPILSEMAQRPEYRVISCTIAEDMTRRWIELKGTGDEAKDDKIDALVEATKRFELDRVFYRAAELDGFFGRSHIYVDLLKPDGKPAIDDLDELRTPIGSGRDRVSREKVGRGSLVAFRVVEPIWTYPTNYNSNDPLRPDWYRPSTWFVMGKQVHATRLLTLIGREVPDLLKPAYSFGGLSLSQMAKPYVDNWLRTRQSVSDITHSFSVFGLKTNLNSLMAQGGEQLFARAETFNALRDNGNVMLLDKDTEDFFIATASLASLDRLQAQAQEHMAAVARVPLVKLLGIQPAGLNASSEGEIRVYYDTIKAMQEHLFRHPVATCLDFIQLSEFGEVDPRITSEFLNLWELDEAAEAAVQSQKAATHAVYVNDIGAVSPQEVREAVAADPRSPYSGLEIERTPAPAEGDPDAGQGEGTGGKAPLSNPLSEREERVAESFGSPETGGFKAEDAFDGALDLAAYADDEMLGGGKLPKSDVDYGPGRPRGDHCGVCAHFLAPDSCEVVAGEISPSAWCEEFERAVGAEDEWAEHLHPRDPDGKFAKAGEEGGAFAKVLAAAGFEKHPESPYAIYTHPGGHQVAFNPPTGHHSVPWAHYQGWHQAHGGKGNKGGGSSPKLAEYLAKQGIGPAAAGGVPGIYGKFLGSAGYQAEGTTPGGAMLFHKGILSVVVDGMTAGGNAKWTIYQGGTPVEYGDGLSSLQGNLDLLEEAHASGSSESATVAASAGESAVGPPLKFAALTQVGPKLGTTPGGAFEDAAGDRFYVKQTQSEAHTENEMLAAALFRSAGGSTFTYRKVLGPEGQTWLASDWADVTKDKADEFSLSQRKAMQSDFAIHAWLANWDVGGAGPEHPGANMGIVDGKVTPLDFGGALLFRGAGKPKGVAFGDDPTEWTKLRDQYANPSAAKLFDDMTADQLKASATRLEAVTPDVITKLVDLYGPGGGTDKHDLAAKLVARRAAILQKAAAQPSPKPKVVSHGSEISPTKYAEFQAAAPKPTKKQASAIDVYTGGYYQDINSAMRQGLPLGDYTETVRALKSYLSAASFPEDAVVTRKVSADYANKLRDRLRAGLVFQDHGFVSSDHWSGDLTLKIAVSKGARAAAVKEWSSHPSEHEIVVAPGSQFKVTGYEPGSNYMEVELLNEGHPDIV